MRWLHAPYPTSLDEVEHQLAERSPNSQASLVLMVEDGDGTTVGIVAVRGAEPESACGELDVYLGEKQTWGQELATDAVRTVCRYAFDAMRLHRVELSVAVGNDVAKHVYDKLGFVVEGRKREVWWRDGRWDDEWLVSLLPGDLR